MDSTRFKSDPYNQRNRALTSSDVKRIGDSVHLSLTVSDISIYQKAFIHKSYTRLADYSEYQQPPHCLPLFKDSYETMEFLGDSLLGSIVSIYVYRRFSKYEVDEGFLTKLKIRLVCGEQLGYLSEKLGLSEHLVISKHIDDACEGRHNIHMLEDIYEAFLGAIYLDSGSLDLVTKFVIQSIEMFVDISDLISRDNNYKDQILRYFQHNFKVHPIYLTEKEETGNLFRCKLYKGTECIEEGTGLTKKKAEQEASRCALLKYHVIS